MSLANKEVPHILWKPAARYHIHKSPLTLPILSQIDPAYDPIIILENYKIILPSVTRSIKRSLSFSFPRKNPLCPSTTCVRISWQARRCYCVKFPLGFKWMTPPPNIIPYYEPAPIGPFMNAIFIKDYPAIFTQKQIERNRYLV